MSGVTLAGLLVRAVLYLMLAPVLLAVAAAVAAAVVLTGGRGCTCYPDD